MDLYSKQLNHVFYHIPKNAMTSIIHTFAFDWVEEEKTIGIPIFAVVREPYKRAVSTFLEVYMRYKGNNIYGVEDPNLYRKISAKRLMEIFESPLKTCVNEYWKEMKNGFFDNHQLPQSFYLNENERSIEKVKTFLIFERLQKEFEDKMNIKYLILDTNKKSPESSESIFELFAPFKGMIEDLYKEDYMLYAKHS